MGLFDFLKPKKKEEVQQEVQQEVKVEAPKAEFNGKIVAPISGRLLPLSEVPDEVFAQKMIGDGVAIEPSTSGTMLAPAAGTLEKIFDTNHAFSIVTPDGIEIFVHFGMDTVALGGKGFERLVQEGDKVEAGTPLIKFDFDYLKENAKSIITPVIISNYDEYSALNGVETGTATAGETVVLDIQK